MADHCCNFSCLSGSRVHYHALRVQTPPKKVFWGGFGGLNPFSRGTFRDEKQPKKTTFQSKDLRIEPGRDLVFMPSASSRSMVHLHRKHDSGGFWAWRTAED